MALALLFAYLFTKDLQKRLLIETITFKKLSNNAFLPTKNNLGYDLYSAVDFTIYPQSNGLISTDLMFMIPKNFYGKLQLSEHMNHSNMQIIKNQIIDSSYKCELELLVQNNSYKPYKIIQGYKFANITFDFLNIPEIKEVKD